MGRCLSVTRRRGFIYTVYNGPGFPVGDVRDKYLIISRGRGAGGIEKLLYRGYGHTLKLLRSGARALRDTVGCLGDMAAVPGKDALG